jgi:glutamate carboxypeptidase
MRELLKYCEKHKREVVSLVRQLVELESPSNDKAAADRCGAFIAAELERRGARLKLHRQKGCGNQIEARFPGRGKPLMLLGHYDTVWDAGTLARMPWREKQGHLYGPGVFDMKSGIGIMLTAIDCLRALRGAVPRPLIVSLNADEEVGSMGSRAITERLAKQSEAVLVIEPAHGTDVKTSRKGVGDFTLKVTGVPAHSGLDFSKGQSAVLEMARQIERLITTAAKGETGVIGIEQTLDRVNDGRVQMLVISEGFRCPSYRCSACGRLTAAAGTTCAVCGGALERISDVVELAVSAVMRAGGEVLVVNDSQAMQRAGNIGAILRY